VVSVPCPRHVRRRRPCGGVRPDSGPSAPVDTARFGVSFRPICVLVGCLCAATSSTCVRMTLRCVGVLRCPFTDCPDTTNGRTPIRPTFLFHMTLRRLFDLVQSARKAPMRQARRSAPAAPGLIVSAPERKPYPETRLLRNRHRFRRALASCDYGPDATPATFPVEGAARIRERKLHQVRCRSRLGPRRTHSRRGSLPTFVNHVQLVHCTCIFMRRCVAGVCMRWWWRFCVGRPPPGRPNCPSCVRGISSTRPAATASPQPLTPNSIQHCQLTSSLLQNMRPSTLIIKL
jgi:hypothetical protein